MFPSFNARAIGLNLTAEATIEIAHQAGFEGVDLLVRDIVDAESDPNALRNRIDQLGLKPGAWPLPMDWKRDQATFEQDLRRLPIYAKAASILGLRRTGTWVLPEVLAPLTFEAAVEMHRARLGAMARVLDDFGIRLGLEVIGVESSRTGDGVPFVHRLGDLNRDFQALIEGHPSIGILLDGFHLYAANESVEAGFAWGVEKIIWVHVADLPERSNGERSQIEDSHRGLPGESPLVPTKALLQRLTDEGYQGPVTAEPLALCRALENRTPTEAADRVIGALNRVWPTSLNAS